MPGEEAYDNYNMTLSVFREYSRLLERDVIIWEIKGTDAFIVVPKEKREALVLGIEDFKKLLEDIVALPHLINPGKEIIKKIAVMQNSKDNMIKELEDALFYASFQGDCKYLSGY